MAGKEITPQTASTKRPKESAAGQLRDNRSRFKMASATGSALAAKLFNNDQTPCELIFGHRYDEG
jgi:hypothetical protein